MHLLYPVTNEEVKILKLSSGQSEGLISIVEPRHLSGLWRTECGRRC